MTLASYELRDPAALVEEVADRVVLEDGRAYLVLVEDPPTHQQVISVEELPLPALISECDAVAEVLREVVDGFHLRRARRPPRHMVVTVLVRRGLCVIGPNEGRWLTAWRYSHHYADVWDGELIVVTEHGWCDVMTGFAGHTPAATR